MSMTRTIMAIIAVMSVSLIAAVSTAPVFAETSESIPFRGSFEGYDVEGDDYRGTFVDFGLYSVFDGIVTTEGIYEFVDDPTHVDGGYYATTYTTSDEIGNSLSFYDVEISFIEYGNGQFGMSQTEWSITGGEGKFSDATGSGESRVWFNLEDMSYRGITSGNVFLPTS